MTGGARRRGAAAAAVAGLLVLLAALPGAGASGCAGTGDGAGAARHPLLVEADRFAALGRSEEARRIDLLARRQLAWIDGWKAGWPEGWAAAVASERTETPARFRRTTLQLGLALGGLTLTLGLLVGLLLADRPRGGADEGPLRGALRDAVAAVRAAVSGPPRDEADVRDPRVVALWRLRDARRHVDAVLAALDGRPDAKAGGDDARSAFRDRMTAWREELARACEGLERAASLDRAGDPEALGWGAEATAAAAETLRVAVARALAGAEPEAWEAWRRRAGDRPALPAAGGGREPAAWALPTGRWGLVGALASCVLMAGWAAVGAVPAGVAALAATGSLGAILAARAELMRRGRSRLLPGPADRLGRVLTAMTLVALLGLALSASATAESGLDMGEPPPIRLAAPPEPPPPPPGRLPRS